MSSQPLIYLFALRDQAHHLFTFSITLFPIFGGLLIGEQDSYHSTLSSNGNVQKMTKIR
jgi:hypothetical protein